MKKVLIALLMVSSTSACKYGLPSPSSSAPTNEVHVTRLIWSDAAANKLADNYRKAWDECVRAEKVLRDNGMDVTFDDSEKREFSLSDGMGLTRFVYGCDAHTKLEIHAVMNLENGRFKTAH